MHSMYFLKGNVTMIDPSKQALMTKASSSSNAEGPGPFSDPADLIGAHYASEMAVPGKFERDEQTREKELTRTVSPGFIPTGYNNKPNVVSDPVLNVFPKTIGFSPVVVFLAAVAGILWALLGFAAFVMSLVCVGRSGTVLDKALGIVVAMLAGPFYWLYFLLLKGYCN